MRISIASLFCSLVLASCVNVADVPNFEGMSEQELAAYNADRPLGQMIVCVDGDRSFSRVRRRTCATVEQMYGSAAQASQLGVLNSVPGYGGP